MKEELLKRLLNLVEKTGDRMVITDPEGERPFVLMGLHQYESIVFSEPQQKPQEPKREIPLWKAPPAPPAPATQAPKPLTTRTTSAPPPAKAAPLRQVPLPPARPPRPAIDAEAMEMEGEERFYLEPLE